MTWDEICADPTLRDLPYKIETNRRGQIIMSPARSRHGEYQSEIDALLRQLLPQGRVVIECPVQTTAGVRVPDVAWTSPERRQPIIYTLAPEICVEVLSPYNDEEEMTEKRALYFEAGAREVWICSEKGRMTFYNPSGLLADGSLFCPGFPSLVEV
jgi:Uma2 family endonuclease